MAAELAGKPIDRSPEAQKRRAITTALDLQAREKLDRETRKLAKPLHSDTRVVGRFLGRILSLADKGVALAAEGGDQVFGALLAGAPVSLSDSEDITLAALLNARWEPSARGVVDTCRTLAMLADEMRQNLERKFPSLAGGATAKKWRRLRVRYLAPHMDDAAIARFEDPNLPPRGRRLSARDRAAMSRAVAAVAKDRAALLIEDRKAEIVRNRLLPENVRQRIDESDRAMSALAEYD